MVSGFISGTLIHGQPILTTTQINLKLRPAIPNLLSEPLNPSRFSHPKDARRTNTTASSCWSESLQLGVLVQNRWAIMGASNRVLEVWCAQLVWCAMPRCLPPEIYANHLNVILKGTTDIPLQSPHHAIRVPTRVSRSDLRS